MEPKPELLKLRSIAVRCNELKNFCNLRVNEVNDIFKKKIEK